MTRILNRAWHERPSWLRKADGILPLMDLDFVNDRYYVQGVPSAKSLFSFTRATVAWYDRGDGIFVQAGSGVVRRNAVNGVFTESAKTNFCLRNRDLTNAVWTKSNVTAALDQVGIDGVTNSASSITATAGNGTCLQAITLANAPRRGSAFVKRLTGSGTINFTIDNGSTWTAISPTTTWQQLAVPAQTLTNPTVGFRIVTSGDAIAVDMAQLESASGAADVFTSPIVTAGASVARNADLYTISTSKIPGFSATQGTLFAEVFVDKELPSSGQFFGIAAFDDNTLNNRIQLRTSTNLTAQVADGAATQASLTQTIAAVGYNRLAMCWILNNIDACFSTTAQTPLFGARDTAATIPVVNQLSIGIGTPVGGTGRIWIRSITYWPVAVAHGDLAYVLPRV